MTGKNIQISFHRKKFRKAMCDYLCSKLDENEDTETISQLKGLTDKTITKLKVKEANELVIKILQAIIIYDDLVTTDEENDIDETENDSEHETDIEVEADLTIKVRNVGDSPKVVESIAGGSKIVFFLFFFTLAYSLGLGPLR